MKICIDMQGAQTESRHRGIGRYCVAVVEELGRLYADRHDIELLFNAALDGIDTTAAALAGAATTFSCRTFGPIRETASDNPANDARRIAAEHVFMHAIDARDADIVWMSSVMEGFTDDALAPAGVPRACTIATLYDLIPLHDPEYLGKSRTRDWYMRRLDLLKRCDLLFAISEWVREDAIQRLALDPTRIISIGAGVDARFVPPHGDMVGITNLRDRFGIRERFVLYNGGFDKRKNVLALIKAYASLPRDIRAEHSLVIVGHIAPLVMEQFVEAMARLRLGSDELCFTDFVSDDDLVLLYQACSLFVFPSEREGFGLAPLEAMACGAPTIVNNATSLPEVVDYPDALFDANDHTSLTDLIQTVLTQPAFANRLRQHGLTRARHFSWAAVAQRAMGAIEQRGFDPLRPLPNAFTSDRETVALDEVDALPIYRFDASNVEELLPQLRQWPGAVIWSGPAPLQGIASPTDRYRLGGYACMVIESHGNDWINLVRQEAIDLRLGEVPTNIDRDMSAWLDALRRSHPLARQRRVEDNIAKTMADGLSDDDLARIADALDRLRPATSKRWLVDVTHIASRDLGTGVHRVVRSILTEWLRHPPQGIRIEPVAFREGRYEHAHAYACHQLGMPTPGDMTDDLVSITGDEVFVGLDWAMESLPASASLLRGWKRAGVAMHFVVYDLLPLTLPDAFHPHTHGRFTTWLETIASLANVLHSISRTTANELTAWLGQHASGRAPEVTSFPLGVEFGERVAATAPVGPLAAAMRQRPSLLMVGTLEPRKGHRQVIEATELLWESGADLNLVIVGHRGWLVRDLIEHIEQHSELNRRLFWLDDADDASLEGIYAEATALVAASHGEGYGLPLIEAAHRGKPVIARALPVFREVAGSYPSYFNQNSAKGLATDLARWLVDRPPPGSYPGPVSWATSADVLRHAIEGFGERHAPKL